MSTPILRGAQALVAACIALAAVNVTTEVANADPGTYGKSTATVETDGGGADRYIVTMRPGAQATSSRAAAVADARRNGAAVRFEYTSVLQGFAARLPQRALDALGRNQHVASIEPDRVVRLTDTQVPATEGLDRVDQRSQPLSGSYTYNVTGAGVTAYVIDTGIRYSHTEFGGRAVSGYDAIDGGSADDCHGHGTHVSGTIGGSTYGMAKAVRVVGVRVLDCQGSGLNSQVIAGLDWVVADHVEGAPAVANLSLGSVASTALDDAVRNTIADGVTVSVSAGNDSSDACVQSPARVAEAITVASSTAADVRSSFSNYGSCVDIFAPGSLITSAYNTSDTATQLMSGTSMASPHVAGAAALLAQQSPTSSPQAIKDALLNSATAGVIGDPGPGTPNRLLFSLGDAPVPPPPAAPEPPAPPAPEPPAPPAPEPPAPPAPEPPAPPAPAPPEPEPVDCADLAEQYAGTLSGFGDQDYFASAAGFQAAAGSHQGCLSGPDGVDFDLALEVLQGSFWVQVASSQGLTADERLTYAGAAGTYRWRVYVWGGSGSYDFGMQRP